MRFLPAIASLSLIAIASCSCASDVAPEDGPLLLGGVPSSLCIPAQTGEQVVFGEVLELPADANESITLDSFSTTGVKIDKALLLPKPVGSFSLNEPIDFWTEERPAEEVIMNPGDIANIAIVLPAKETETMRVGRLTVDYHTEGQKFTAEATMTVEVLDSCF